MSGAGGVPLGKDISLSATKKPIVNLPFYSICGAVPERRCLEFSAGQNVILKLTNEWKISGKVSRRLRNREILCH